MNAYFIDKNMSASWIYSIRLQLIFKISSRIGNILGTINPLKCKGWPKIHFNNKNKVKIQFKSPDIFQMLMKSFVNLVEGFLSLMRISTFIVMGKTENSLLRSNKSNSSPMKISLKVKRGFSSKNKNKILNKDNNPQSRHQKMLRLSKNL